MKKTAIALFSVSITAGTVYLIYDQAKSRLIDKLIKLWKEEAKKKDKEKELDSDYLKSELDKLFIWDINLLSNYFSKFIHQAPKEMLAEYFKKITARKIPEKADLKSVERVFGGS